jgi:hypothetical protein
LASGMLPAVVVLMLRRIVPVLIGIHRGWGGPASRTAGNVDDGAK